MMPAIKLGSGPGALARGEGEGAPEWEGPLPPRAPGSGFPPLRNREPGTKIREPGNQLGNQGNQNGNQ